MKAIEQASFAAGKDIPLGPQCASTGFFNNGAYHHEGEGKTRSIAAQVDYLAKLVGSYPIVTIEDGRL